MSAPGSSMNLDAARRAARRVAATIVPRSVLIVRGEPHRRRVALTFDDGPDDMTERYLDELDRLGVRATFFVVGEACLARPDLVAEVARRGHELAVHGFTHRLFPPMSAADLRREIASTAELLPPQRRKLLRPPNGATSIGSLLVGRACGFTTVLWSVDSGDCRTRDADDVVRGVDADALIDGDIVLLHEGQPWTLEALGAIVERLAARGFEATPVGDLIGP